MNIHIYHHYPEFTKLIDKLDLILIVVNKIQAEVEKMLPEFQVLIDEVAAVKTESASAVVAITGMVAKLNELIQNGTDLAEVKAQALAMVQDMQDNVVVPLAAAVATVPAL